MNTIIRSFMERYSNSFRKNIALENINKSRDTENSTIAKNEKKNTNSKIGEVNMLDMSFAQQLSIDRHNNLTIGKNQVYGISTNYGLINYRFINDASSRYVQTLYFDSQISDEKRVHLERKRQFLTDLQIFSETGQSNVFYTGRESIDVLKEFENLGINTEEPFTMNNSALRYRIDPSGVLHEVDLESQGMKEKDWRKYGHDENTVFVIQGKEYKMDKDGRLPLPEDYIHKYEQVEIIKNK
ncbi:hypothetical protein [Psychrobacillus sp. L3]|uniref:hypothetical protein n=1 Tax=Psychrobacillus sp. L3 TaxID=3236891 RepID=UPI0036F3C03D